MRQINISKPKPHAYCEVCGSPIFNYKREKDNVCSLFCYLILKEDRELFDKFFPYEKEIYDDFILMKRK